MATDFTRVKMLLREEEIPFFTDAELQIYLDENAGVENDMIYHCLLIKAQSTMLSVSGLTTADMSSYFLRLAQRYKPNNSGTL